MEYIIAHETSYRYPEEVRESYTVLHLQPRTDALQFCTRYELKVVPRVRVHRYVDRFANDVQHFAVLAPHTTLSIVAHSSVVTMAPQVVPQPGEATRAQLDGDEAVDDFYDFLHESAYVQFTPELEAFMNELEPPGESIGAWCHAVAHAIHERLAYDLEETTVHTTVAESLAARAGVCQDFAHVMIAVLRRARIPARYVSGYVFRGQSRVLGAEASHAWCEAYLPPYRWIGFDPTNDRLVDDHFVKVAIGRDYRDVSPVRGVYKGSGRSEMSVNVAMDARHGQQ